MNEPIWVRMGVRPKHWHEMTDREREQVVKTNAEYRKHDMYVRRAPHGAVKNTKQDAAADGGEWCQRTVNRQFTGN